MIRKAIVGMMKRFRIARSLHPWAAARERESSLASTRTVSVPCRRRFLVGGRAGRRPAPRQAGRQLRPYFLKVACQSWRQAVERLLGRALAADDEGIEPVVDLGEQLGVLRHRPEVLHHEHRLVEGLVVGRRVAELVGLEDRLARGVAAELGPALLGLVLDEPLEELHRLFLVLRVADDRDALAAERRVLVAVRPGRVGEEAGVGGVRVDRRVDQRREEGEVVHAHRRQALGDRLVVLLEEGLAPVGRRELVEFAVHLERLHRLVGVHDPVDLVGRIVAEIAAVGEERVLDAHHQAVIGVVGVDRDAVAVLVRAVEELGDVAHLRHRSSGTARS